MNSRERIKLTLEFKEPDRVPVDLGGTTGASGIHVLAYHRLKRHLGCGGPVKCYDMMQQLALVEEEIRLRLHTDVIQINALTGHRNWEKAVLFDHEPALEQLIPAGLDLKITGEEALLVNPAGKRFHMPKSSYYFDAEDGKSWFSYPYELTDEFLAALQKNTRELYESTGYALAGNFSGNFFSSDPEFMMDMLLEPAKIEDTLAKRCDALIEKYRLLHQSIGAYTFCIAFADDFGAQNAPLLDPDTFRTGIAPHYRRFTDWLHRETDWKLYLHSCGAIEPLLEDIIGMGVDILNPIQTSATGMDPAMLKAKYGRRVVFWGGGCDTQHVLGYVDQATLAEHVRERLAILAPGGGFVFNQVHAIQPTVDPESIRTLFDTVHEYGQYPIR